MSLLYVFLILVGIPFMCILLYNIYEEFENNIIQFFKSMFSCLGQVITVLIAIILLLFINSWLFKDCTLTDSEELYYDYDPHMNKK